MATITPIKNSKKGAYRITVSNGYDSNNKQIRVSTTFTPDKTKSQRQQEKQVQEFAIDFERQVKTGKVYSGDKISFADFTKEWEEKEAKQNLEETTLYSYNGHLKNVILPAIGKYKMSKVTPVILEQFYRIPIEDNAELRILDIPNLVTLEARCANLEGTGEITIRELIRTALRMRPNRIIVGEVRGAEAIDMLQALICTI